MRTLLSRRIAQALVLAAALSPALSHADEIKLVDLTGAETDNVIRELSANFAYSSQTPASSLGGLWGFELGLVGGITKTPEIRDLVRSRADANFKQDKFPHAGVLGRVGAPFGLTGEVVILPKIKASDVELSQYGGAVQWTVTDVFFKNLPVNVAVKGYVSKTSLSFKQVVRNANVPASTVNGKISFDNTNLGGQLLVSKRLSVFEPYVGVGFSKANGELSVTTDDINFMGTIFTTGATRAKSKPSSAQLMAGLDVRLLFISLGAEYQRSFGTDSLSGRLSFRF
jgi:hypothetical protein